MITMFFFFTRRNREFPSLVDLAVRNGLVRVAYDVRGGPSIYANLLGTWHVLMPDSINTGDTTRAMLNCLKLTRKRNVPMTISGRNLDSILRKLRRQAGF